MELSQFYEQWPFSVVPNQDDGIMWAGRPQLLKQANSLLTGFAIRPQSTLDLMWSAFGAGKTHLLLYLRQESLKTGKIFPWYIVIPQSAKNFSEVYRSLMRSFPFSDSKACLTKSLESAGSDIAIADILRALTMGTDEQARIAKEWICGLKVDLRTAKRLLPIPFKLDTIDQMQRVLFELLRLLSISGKRTFLLMDEYQRVQGHRAGTKDVLNSVALDAFNATASGLSIIFSCSAVQQSSAQRILSPELQDRMRGRKIISLPELTPQEAIEFIVDINQFHRPSAYEGDKFSPFCKDVLVDSVQELANANSAGILPRHLIQVLDYSLGVALENGEFPVSKQIIIDAVQNVVASEEQ